MTAALLTDSIPADVRGWWVSEKYDGVRAVWTGSRLLSRNGKDLKAPAWFTRDLPNVRLDGELWMGRGTFDQLVSVIQRKGGDWDGVMFMVFEIAGPGTFEERNSALASVPLPGHCRLVSHYKLSSSSMLDAMEVTIVHGGGEGCVIRRPGSLYRPGRCGDTIKVKRLVSDVDRWQG